VFTNGVGTRVIPKANQGLEPAFERCNAARLKPRPFQTVLSRGSDDMKLNESIPLYRDGRHYDALNSFLVADIPFYLEEARKARGPVLELACGT